MLTYVINKIPKGKLCRDANEDLLTIKINGAKL